MIDRCLSWAFENRAVVLLLTLLMAGLGLRSLGQLPIDAVPDVTDVQVQINTNSPGLSPPEVERLITFPVEQAMAGLPDLRQVRSLSKYGLSQVTVVFEDGTDLYFARQLVLERLQVARAEIPPDLGEPEMGPISSGLGEIYQYELRGQGHSLTELRALQDWFVKRQLLTVEGVTEVNSFGGLEKQYQVVADPFRLRAYNLTLVDLYRAIAENNRNAGAGFMEYRDEQYLIRGVGLVTGIRDIESIILTEENGTAVTVADVAQVTTGPALRQGAVSRDGRGEAVTGIVMMLVGENSRAVARRVDARLQEIQAQLPEGVTIEPFYDRTELVDRTIHTVARNLAEGAVLVIVVLFAMVGNFRAALITALAIPLSMLFASTLMLKAGVSGNLMSLGAIDFGLLVDGSVVMVENALRRLSHNQDRPRHQVLLESAQEVGRPIAFGIGIIIVVYLPVMSLTGMEGKMFHPMAFTVVFALLGSLLLALTTTPVLVSLLVREAGHSSRLDSLKVRYRSLLATTLPRPLPIVTAAVALFAVSLVAFSRLGAEFIPELDEGALAVQAIRLPSVSLTTSLAQAQQIEKALLEFDEVTGVVSKTGRPDLATDPMGVEISDVLVSLRPDHQTPKAELVAAMEERLEQIPGIAFSFSQPIELRVEELVSGVRSDVALKIFGDDLPALRLAAERAAARIRTIPGARDVAVEQTTGLPYLDVEVDRRALARHGINVADLTAILEVGLGEASPGTVVEGDRRFPIVIKLDPRFTLEPEALGAIPVPGPRGRTIPLDQLARLEVETGLAQISRENGQRRVVVEANVRGRDLVSFVHQAREEVAEVIGPGMFPVWGGEFENFERARSRLLVVVPITLAVILVLLFAHSGSAEQAMLVFLNVPFAVTGGVAALVLRGMPFSISAGVGFIALFGIAVLNGLVLLSRVSQLREQLPLYEAVVEGSLDRLRPVLTTALVAGLGFLPMAFGHGAGAEVQRPLATVVIGGLVTSTVLTLLVIPTLYHWWEKEFKADSAKLEA